MNQLTVNRMTSCSQVFVLLLCAWAWHTPTWGFAIRSPRKGRLVGSSATRRAMQGGDPSSSYLYQDDVFRRDAHKTFDPKTTSRRPILAGNWKLNPSTLGDATILLKLLQANFVNHRASRDSSDMPQVVVFPPTPYLEQAVHLLQGSGIQVGAQDVGLETSGAFTGEVAASMIRSVGCDFCLLGHSERRTLYEETDNDINTKVHLCLREPGLQVILCIGETLEEYGSGLLQSVVDIQIKKGLQGVTHANLHRIVIAYEPIWAIGTGKVASPEEAQQAHVAVRKSLAAVFGLDQAARVRIQYGGSVKPDNAEEILAMPDVDGALVGGASLSADSFTRIVDGAIRSSVVANPASLPPREFMATPCLPVKNVLGESPVWSVRDQALYWIDAPEGEVWTWNMKDAAYCKKVGTALGCVAIHASHQKGSIVLAGESAFLSMVLSPNPSVQVLTDRPEPCDVTRPNDGRVDRQGRLVFGMYNNYHRSPVGDPNVGGLYRLDPNGNTERILDESLNYRVSNCISFSPNGNTMYFCDTPTRKIYAFDYGAQLTNRRLIWTMPSHMDGGPDGAQVGT
jgi:triosephosphate isomerase